MKKINNKAKAALNRDFIDSELVLIVKIRFKTFAQLYMQST